MLLGAGEVDREAEADSLIAAAPPAMDLPSDSERNATRPSSVRSSRASFIPETL